MIKKLFFYSFFLTNMAAELCCGPSKITPEEVAVIGIVSLRRSVESFDISTDENQRNLEEYRRLTRHTDNPGSIKRAIRDAFGLSMAESIDYYDQLQILKEEFKKED